MGYLEKKLQAIISTLNNWKYYSGNLYVMTSDTAPSPFVASRTSAGTLSLSGSPYQAFNNGTSNNFGCWYTSAGGYTQANLIFNLTKEIKIKTITYSFYNTFSGGSANGTNHIEIYDGTSWIEIYNVAWNTEAERSGTIDISAGAYADTLIYGIRAKTSYSGGSTSANGYVRKCQVTEWYEKG